MQIWSTLAFLAAFCAAPVFSELEGPDWTSSNVSEAERWVDFLRLRPYLKSTRVDKVRVAILGSRFGGLELDADSEPIGKYLPRDATYRLQNHASSSRFEADFSDSTDRRLAQLVWALTGYSESNAPQIRVYNAHGPLNFARSVEDAVDWGADVYLNTVLFDGFNNFDGSGEMARLVREVSASGALWIQSVGSVGQGIIEVPVKCVRHSGSEQRVAFSGETALPFLLHSDGQELSLTLSWNDWPTGSKTEGTQKDLDLLVLGRDSGKKEVVLASSERRQVLSDDPDVEDDETSLLPFEEVTGLRLPKSTDWGTAHKIAVRCRSGEFDPARDRLRVTVRTSQAASLNEKGVLRSPLELKVASNVLPTPGDLGPLHVLSVGDLSEYSTRGTAGHFSGRNFPRPDVELEPVQVRFSDGASISGPDVATAKMAAMAVWLRGAAPGLRQKHLASLAASSLKQAPTELPTEQGDEAGREKARRDGWAFEPSQLPGAPWDVLSKLDEFVAVRQVKDNKDELLPYWEVWVSRHPARMKIFSALEASTRQTGGDHHFFLKHQTVRGGSLQRTVHAYKREGFELARVIAKSNQNVGATFFWFNLAEVSWLDCGQRCNTRRWSIPSPDGLARWVEQNP